MSKSNIESILAGIEMLQAHLIGKKESARENKILRKYWNTLVVIRKEFRHDQPFKSVFPSFHINAIVLSFVGVRSEVCQLL